MGAKQVMYHVRENKDWHDKIFFCPPKPGFIRKQSILKCFKIQF